MPKTVVDVSKPKDDEVKYVVLCETNDEECESWYYFIKYNGNQEALEYLQKQLEKIDMYLDEGVSTFDLDLDHFFSETTAKEMTKLEVNSFMFHRKFDGKLGMINLGLKKKNSTEVMLRKLTEKLGLGKVEEYIGDEDIDTDDITSSEDEAEGSEDLVTPPPELADAEPLPELSPKSKLLSRVVPDDFKMRRKQKKHKKK